MLKLGINELKNYGLSSKNKKGDLMEGQTIILTDSSCDLDIKYVRDNNIVVLPLSYVIDGKLYADDLGQELPYKDFYTELRLGNEAKTSQVNVDSYRKVFKQYADNGYSMIYIGLSSKLSGTLNNAKMARDYLLDEIPSIDLTIIDSKSASAGLGATVYYASEMLKNNKTNDEIIDWIINNTLKVQHLFTVGNLEHLKKGGRISPAMAAVGGVLSIKPLLIVDNQGQLQVVKTIRGRKKSIKFMLNIFAKKVQNPEEQTIFINHGDCLEDAIFLKNSLLKRFTVKDVKLNYVGPTMGSHTGPDMLCLIFLSDNRQLN